MSPFRDSPSTHRIITHVPRSATSVQCRRQCSTRGAAEPTRELVLSTRRRDARRPLVKMVPGRCGHVSPTRRVHFSCRTQYGRVAIVCRRRYRRRVTVKANCRSPLPVTGRREMKRIIWRAWITSCQSRWQAIVFMYTDSGQRQWDDFLASEVYNVTEPDNDVSVNIIQFVTFVQT